MSKTRIIFVDDEPSVLEGLRRMLRRQRNEWEMTFVSSGADALAAIGERPFDVIVTDLRMPGMGGDELLQKVFEEYPDTARIVLTGHASSELATGALKLAHQYLAKPVDSDNLKQAVARACAVQQTVSDERIRAAVGGCDALPTLPSLYAEITQAAESQTANAKTLAQIISRDMAMSAKLLQLVNSSFFGIGRRVSSIEQAVALLGMVRIKALVLSESIFKQFALPKKTAGLSVDGLWAHSLLVADVARNISREEGQGGDRPDQAFTAGVLHDVGKLILMSRQTDAFEAILNRAQALRAPLWLIEMDVFGVTHAQIGAYLLNLWGLPPRIAEAVELHHTPSSIAYDGLCALTVVHAANALVGEQEKPEPSGAASCALDMTYLRRTGLEHRHERWREIAAETCEKAMEAEA